MTWLAYTLVFAGFVASVLAYPRVPNPMPVHWNLYGQADGFAPRALGLLLIPALAALLTAFMAWLLPRHLKGPSAERATSVILMTIPSFMLAVHLLMIRAALRADMSLSSGALVVCLGVMFAILGWVMPLLLQNPVAGIRTPWSLKNETNWLLTHRFAKVSLAVAGAACVVAGLLLEAPALFVVTLGAILLGSLSPAVYSYFIHRMGR